MSNPTSTKSKPRPWIPAGRGMTQPKRSPKKVTVSNNTTFIKSKKDVPALPKVSPVIVSKTESKNVDSDLMSLSSHSSCEPERLNPENESDVHCLYLLQEMKLLYVHFESIKISYLSVHRLIDCQDNGNGDLNELFIEAGSLIKTLHALFDDLEYSVTVFENTLNESQKKVEFSTVLKCKEKLLSNLLEMYEKVVLIFQVIFTKQDFKELLKVQESLCEQLKIAEKKCATQEAIITDLERKLSIYQSQVAMVENYKVNLERAKVELEKNMLHKDSQIKYLKEELMNSIEKYSKSDREDFVDIIESIKSKAHSEKSALKKALRFLKTQSEKKDETYKECLQEANEKEKMMQHLATQRDHLKVQLTVFNNNIIELKHQVEVMKTQNLKLQNEMTEKDISFKKEMAELKSVIQEKASELDEHLKKRKKLEETVLELEDELKKSKEKFKVLKNKTEKSQQLDFHTSKETDMPEEISQLATLLQSTKETFENFIGSGYFMPPSNDCITETTEFGGHQKNILSTVNEIKNYILELRSHLLTFLDNHRDNTEPKSTHKKSDLEKQFKKMEHNYKSVMKENDFLKQKLEHFNVSPPVQNDKNYFSTDTPSDNLAKNLQLEIYEKDQKIASLKLELAQREKDIENQLRESKDKLRTLEIDHSKATYLESELKNTKAELQLLQKKKDEETENLLRRVQELQENVDKKTEECKHLEQYIQTIKVSYFKVFGNS